MNVKTICNVLETYSTLHIIRKLKYTSEFDIALLIADNAMKLL